MELKDIKAIIDLMKKNDLSVFEMEKDGFRLKLQKGAGEQTVFAPPADAADESPPPQRRSSGGATAPAATGAAPGERGEQGNHLADGRHLLPGRLRRSRRLSSMSAGK